MRSLLPILVVGLLVAAPECAHRRGGGEDVAPAATPAPVATYTHTETVTRLPDEQPVHDPGCRCTVPVPQGWIAYRVESDPTSVVRLERREPPVMTVEVFRGDERVPEGDGAFLDRGPYLPTGDDREVTVWTVDEPGEPPVRRFGVMVPTAGEPLVIEGWLPHEDFEPAKRALDAVIVGITFDDGALP